MTLSITLQAPLLNSCYRFIAWSHWACTSAAWQDYFRGEDEDPSPKVRQQNLL